PLNATEQYKFTRRQLQNLISRSRSRLGSFVGDITRHYMRYHADTEGFNGGYLHDPIAVAVALFPNLARTRKLHVEIETRGGITRGMTVAHLRIPHRMAVPKVNVVESIDVERFISLFNRRVFAR
ncbi:MAG: nucleoside hydrolase, partial [Ignavibacteriales bacterium]|nr:nucleoside hydrolase [Ignavibacteriales bacterium]